MSKPWFFEDVAFDVAHAEAAITALRRLGEVVDDLGDARARAVGPAREDWTGRLSVEFDDAHTATQQGLVEAANRIRAAIAIIRRAQTNAEDDQAARLVRRAQYEEELAAERRTRPHPAVR